MKVFVYKASDSYEVETMMEYKNLNEYTERFGKPFKQLYFTRSCDKLDDLINELLQDNYFGIHPEPSIIVRKPKKDFILKDVEWILELYDDWIE